MTSVLVRVAACSAIALGFCTGASAAGDAYPVRPVSIIVPNAAGGPTDAVARALGLKLAARLGQPVIIDNRGGAGGTIAAEAVARAKPDGYTLLFSTTGTLAINPAVYGPKLRYDAAKGFDPVALIASTSNVLVVRAGLQVNNAQDLIALAKRKSDELTYASSGIGASNHLAMELFKTKAGVQIRHIPYKAAGLIHMDLREGRVDMGFGPEASALHDLVEMAGGKAVMVTGPRRSALFPNVPTAAEIGLKDYNVEIWYGLNAPAGTPPEIVARLNKETLEILSTPEFTKQFLADGLRHDPMTPAQ